MSEVGSDSAMNFVNTFAWLDSGVLGNGEMDRDLEMRVIPQIRRSESQDIRSPVDSNPLEQVVIDLRESALYRDVVDNQAGTQVEGAAENDVPRRNGHDMQNKVCSCLTYPLAGALGAGAIMGILGGVVGAQTGSPAATVLLAGTFGVIGGGVAYGIVNALPAAQVNNLPA